MRQPADELLCLIQADLTDGQHHHLNRQQGFWDMLSCGSLQMGCCVQSGVTLLVQYHLNRQHCFELCGVMGSLQINHVSPHRWGPL